MGLKYTIHIYLAVLHERKFTQMTVACVTCLSDLITHDYISQGAMNFSFQSSSLAGNLYKTCVTKTTKETPAWYPENKTTSVKVGISFNKK